jgi:hypothetical protein
VITIENVRLFNETRGARRQAATAEILRVISGSPTTCSRCLTQSCKVRDAVYVLRCHHRCWKGFLQWHATAAAGIAREDRRVKVYPLPFDRSKALPAAPSGAPDHGADATAPDTPEF